MTALWDVPAGEILPGDIIHTEQDDITVVSVEPISKHADHYPGGYRIHGRITRGYGRGKRILSWSYYPDHRFPTVLRGEP